MSSLKRAINPMSDYIFISLKENNLLDEYNERPDYQKNDYIGWIARAKLESTKEKRLNQMIDKLKGGKIYMNMKWKE